MWGSSPASAATISPATRSAAATRARWLPPGSPIAAWPLGIFGARLTPCPSTTDGPFERGGTRLGEENIPGLRAADRGARDQDRRTALRADRVRRRHLGGDRPALEEEPAADEGHLQPAHSVADHQDRPAS